MAKRTHLCHTDLITTVHLRSKEISLVPLFSDTIVKYDVSYVLPASNEEVRSSVKSVMHAAFVVRNLKSRPDLNGSRADIISKFPEQDVRIGVMVRSELIRVHPHSLQFMYQEGYVYVRHNAEALGLLTIVIQRNCQATILE